MLALPTASSGERRNQPLEWEGTQTLRKERHAHRWPTLVRGAVLALPMRSSKSRELIPQSEGTQTPRRERHAHKWPSMVRGAMLARQTRRATYHRALESGELIRQNERGTQTLRRERPAHRWPSRSSQVKSSLALLSILPHVQYIHTENWNCVTLRPLVHTVNIKHWQ